MVHHHHHQNKLSDNNVNPVSNHDDSQVTQLQNHRQEVIQSDNNGDKALFHDFLGLKLASAAKDSPDMSSGRSVRCPLSSTSDLASVARHVGNHLEGIPFYGPRSDISCSEISNRLAGSKRSSSDSAFTGLTRDGIPRMAHDSLESLHLMKATRLNTTSLMLQSSTGSRLDANSSKWERSVVTGTAVQYPPRLSQFVPFIHQVPANKFRDLSASTSIISQSAADEGSRTGIEGPGILSSIYAGSGISEKNSLGSLPSGCKVKSGIQISEPESSTSLSCRDLTPASRQMTIFYDGQAHVFDDVHPNKADIIMALAGSNGGSWSTTYSPKPTRHGGENYPTRPDNEASLTADAAFRRELQGRPPGTANTTQQASSNDRISTLTGGNQLASIMIPEKKRAQIQEGEANKEEKREV